MEIINKHFEQITDFHKGISTNYIGRRIRMARTEKGLSQTELGEKLDLNADMIQKYENGARHPKSERLKQIASVLGVETNALTVPAASSLIGAMYVLFEMEELYGCKPIEEDGRICLVFGDGITDPFSKQLKGWLKECHRIETELSAATSNGEKTEILKSYSLWKWTYPKMLVDEINKILKKASLEEKIKELQDELNKIDEES